MCFVTSPPHSLKWAYMLWANIPVMWCCVLPWLQCWGTILQEIQDVYFLAFSMSMLFTKLHFLRHTTPDLWQRADQTEDILSSPNVNYMSAQWRVTWERWRMSTRAILPSEWCCGSTTRAGLQGGHLHSQAHDRSGTAWVFCFYSLTQNILWRHITLPPQLTKMLLFPLSLKMRCGWKKWKEMPFIPWQPVLLFHFNLFELS